MGKTEINEIACQIIAYAGDGKSYVFEAIESAENGDFENAQKMLEKCDEEILKAHEIHTKLLVEEARNPETSTVTMMLIHASNHLSNAELARDFADKIINIYKKGVIK